MDWSASLHSFNHIPSGILIAMIVIKCPAMKLKYTTPQFISNWERGISHPPIKDIKTIAKVYKVDADYLFTLIKDNILMKESQKLERWFRGSK